MVVQLMCIYICLYVDMRSCRISTINGIIARIPWISEQCQRLELQNKLVRAGQNTKVCTYQQPQSDMGGEMRANLELDGRNAFAQGLALPCTSNPATEPNGPS